MDFATKEGSFFRPFDVLKIMKVSDRRKVDQLDWGNKYKTNKNKNKIKSIWFARALWGREWFVVCFVRWQFIPHPNPSLGAAWRLHNFTQRLH